MIEAAGAASRTSPATMVPYQENRVLDGWHWWYHFGTGDMGNDGVHDLDIGRWGLGVDVHPHHRAGTGLDFPLESVRRAVDFLLHEVDGLGRATRDPNHPRSPIPRPPKPGQSRPNVRNQRQEAKRTQREMPRCWAMMSAANRNAARLVWTVCHVSSATTAANAGTRHGPNARSTMKNLSHTQKFRDPYPLSNETFPKL